MALIQCPECGREISDRVTACPHCGYPLTEQVPSNLPPQTAGEAQSYTAGKRDKTPKSAFIPLIVTVCIIAAIVAGIMFKRANDEKVAALNARNEYIDNLRAIRSTMMEGAIDAEDVCILTHDVWYNTIYEEYDLTTDEYTRNSYGSFYDDFNDSLKALYADEEIINAISVIKDNRESVDDLMRKLQNPESEFTACYDTVDAMYDAYCGLVNLATSPSGSLTSYTDTYRTNDTNFAKYYEKLDTQIPDKQE